MVAEQKSGIGTISDTIVIFLWSRVKWVLTVKIKVDLQGQGHVKLPQITRWSRKSICISVDAKARTDHNGTFSDFLSQFEGKSLTKSGDDLKGPLQPHS